MCLRITGCHGYGFVQAHLRGRKHKRRADVVGVRVQRPSSHYCKICDITTTSAQHMAMHVAGKVRPLAPSTLPVHCVTLLNGCSSSCGSPQQSSSHQEGAHGPAQDCRSCMWLDHSNVWFLFQAHCRRLATGHLPAAAQGVALDADPVVESARKEVPKALAAGRSALPGSSGPMHPSAPPPPPRVPGAPINRLTVRCATQRAPSHAV